MKMMESQTFEYSSDDIGDEDVILEWEPRPSGQPPLCPRDGHPMTERQQTYTLAGGRFVVTYEAWVCSECGEVFLDRQQARRFGALQMLDRLLKERHYCGTGGETCSKARCYSMAKTSL